MIAEAPPVEHVGRFGLSVAKADPTPETAATWSRRAEALAAWLLAEWKREGAGNVGSAGRPQRKPGGRTSSMN
ncbi:MAG: hypothetical protein R6X20_11540 [Phycisphaerae bacterium]